MITKHDIETKDFSLSLPDAIRKIKAISGLLMATGDHVPGQAWVGEEELFGIGSILGDAVNDLEIINQALHNRKGG